MKAVEITSLDFSRYGIFYSMTESKNGSVNINHSTGPDWEDYNTSIPVIDTLAHIGYTTGSGCPFMADMMERHLHTQEALFAAGTPVVFLVAEDRGTASPNAGDVVPVILRPGHIAVLHRNVWHSSAHGLDKAAFYYYLALCYRNEPTEWKKITGGPVNVEL
jgi:ureidoglycolate lyase